MDTKIVNAKYGILDREYGNSDDVDCFVAIRKDVFLQPLIASVSWMYDGVADNLPWGRGKLLAKIRYCRYAL